MKKSFLIWLVIVLMISPWGVGGQEIIPPTEELIQNIESSWREATIIWTWMFNIIRPIWNKNIVPIWHNISIPIRRWIEDQINKLQNALREDKEKIKETAQREIGEQKQSINQSIWQAIRSALGF